MRSLDEYRLTPAGLKFWARSKEWSLDDAACLFIGADPIKYRKRLVNSRHNYRAQADYQIAELVRQELGAISTRDKYAPTDIFRAADLLEMKVPKELRDEVERFNAKRLEQSGGSTSATAGGGSSAAKPASEEESAKPVEQSPSGPELRRFNSALKVIAAMAFDGYGWRPNVRGGYAREIEDATRRVGAPVSDDTIRALLSEALELIDLSSETENGS